MDEAINNIKRKRTPRTAAPADHLKDMLAERDDLRSQVAGLNAKLAEAEKQKGSAITSKESATKERDSLQQELEQLHALLDALPNCLPRETQVGEHSWNMRKNAAMTRLASWLAPRG